MLNKLNQIGQVRLIPLRPDVLNLKSLGKTKIYEKIATGDFPQPVRLGRRITFVEQEIDTWILKEWQSVLTGADDEYRYSALTSHRDQKN